MDRRDRWIEKKLTARPEITQAFLLYDRAAVRRWRGYGWRVRERGGSWVDVRLGGEARTPCPESEAVSAHLARRVARYLRASRG